MGGTSEKKSELSKRTRGVPPILTVNRSPAVSCVRGNVGVKLRQGRKTYGRNGETILSSSGRPVDGSPFWKRGKKIGGGQRKKILRRELETRLVRYHPKNRA